MKKLIIIIFALFYSTTTFSMNERDDAEAEKVARDGVSVLLQYLSNTHLIQKYPKTENPLITFNNISPEVVNRPEYRFNHVLVSDKARSNIYDILTMKWGELDPDQTLSKEMHLKSHLLAIHAFNILSDFLDVNYTKYIRTNNGYALGFANIHYYNALGLHNEFNTRDKKNTIFHQACYLVQQWVNAWNDESNK